MARFCMGDSKLLFIHGLEGSSRGAKAKLLRKYFPDICIPDFAGSLAQRMEHLRAIISLDEVWTIIGSSFGGLMAALFASENPGSVRRLILLAPALVWPEFAQLSSKSINIPTVIYHGQDDRVIPIDIVRQLAERIFTDLNFRAVDDDHGLHNTAQSLNWESLIWG